ncbi:hypothetical protein [Solibacillus sp. CAU 1738]|uniref:hypothetical protein n=1 Tax=Solibacillus sp. CAU 1738 TaxID=3140363 RepID=UPI00325FFFB6
MKQMLVVCFLMINLVLLGGCTTNERDKVLEKFDDSKIIFSKFTEDTAGMNFKTYSVTLTNNNELPLKYLDLYFSYPILEDNGSKGNTFFVIGLPSETSVELNANKSITYTFAVNLASLDIQKVDMKNPSLKLRGYIGESIPFEISGSIGALVKDYK